MNGTFRVEPRSGISRLVPRGMFSMSQRPIGMRGGEACSRQTLSGTTTKCFRAPMRWGPSVFGKTQDFRQFRLRLGNRPHATGFGRKHALPP